MATDQENAQYEEMKDQSTEKRNKMHKCYKYMSNLKKLLSKSDYSQFLVFLRMSRDNYMSEKMTYYALIVSQIFFPSQITTLISNYDVRKSLFLQSKYFFSKADREAYSAACYSLIQRADLEVTSYLATNISTPQKDNYDVHEKTKSSECTEYQDKVLPKTLNEGISVDALFGDEKRGSEGSEEEKKTSPEKSSVICMICFESYEEDKKFAKAKCGHVACWNCWNQWLFNCLECPMCKQRTRVKQLITFP